jgi:uncharacterized protein (DUF58 family)
VNDSASLIPKAMTATANRRKRLGMAFGPRFFLLLLIGFLWLCPAAIDARFFYGMLLWDLLALAAWGIDLAKLPRPSLISVTRSWNAPAALSVAASIDLVLNNDSGMALRIAILDNVPLQLRPDAPELDLIAPPHGTVSKFYNILPRQRGEALLGSVYLRYQSLFRIAERWAIAELDQKICVYPNLEEARRHSVYLIRSRQIELEKRYSRSRGQGREFESLREYRDGDEFRNICWRAAGRRGKLITRLFQTERSQTIWLVLDSGRLMRTKVFGLSKLDYAVNAALSLGQVALGSGDRVGLLAYGRSVRHRVLPYRGSLHLRKLIEQLALVREESSESDHLQAVSILLSTQTRRSLVVWITDLAETAMTPEVIEAAGQILSRHLVIFVVIGQPDLGDLAAREPGSVSQMYLAAAAQEIAHRREVLLARLRSHGTLAIEVDSGRVAAAIINSYLEVKERNLI